MSHLRLKPSSGFLSNPEKKPVITISHHPPHSSWLHCLSDILFYTPVPQHTLFIPLLPYLLIYCSLSTPRTHTPTSGILYLLFLSPQMYFSSAPHLLPTFFRYQLLSDASLTTIFKLQHSIFLPSYYLII